MRTRHFHAVTALSAIFALALLPGAALGQSSDWTVPRTRVGPSQISRATGATHAVTPLERPESLGERAALTDEELAQVQTTAEELFALDAGDAAFGDQFFNVALTAPETFTSSDGGTGNYNQFWLVERDFNNRTSLITDPPNGRLPRLTAAAQAAAAAARANRGRPAAWTEDRGLSERCITFGLPNLLAGYNSYYQILQTADHVVIEQELIHTDADHPDRRAPAHRPRHRPVARQLGRPLGRRYARGRDHALLAAEQLPGLEREPASHRALHARGSGRHALRVHRHRSDGLGVVLDGPDGVEADRPRPSSSMPATRATSAWRASSRVRAPTTPGWRPRAATDRGRQRTTAGEAIARMRRSAMNRRPLVSIAVLALAVAATWLAPRPAEGQSGSPPRTAWGDPDLQGVWDYRTVTPMERPEEFEGQAFLTVEEAAELEQRAVERQVDRPPRAGDPGTYKPVLDGLRDQHHRHPAHVAHRRSAGRENPRPGAGGEAAPGRAWPRRARASATTCRGPGPGWRTCR